MNEKSQKNKLPKKFLFLKKEKKNPKNEKLQQSNYRKNSCFVKKTKKKYKIKLKFVTTEN